MPGLSMPSYDVLRIIADALPGGSVNVFDRAYRYLFAAGTGLATVGLSEDVLIGRSLREVFGEQAALVEPYYARAFTGEHVAFDLPVGDRTYALTAAPFSDQRGAIVVLAQDVTAVRGEIRARETAAATLAQVNQQKDAFFTTVLHELRQPLAPLRFALESVKRQTAGLERPLVIMERQVGQLERLVRDLSEIAHGLPVHGGSVELVAVLSEAVEGLEPLMRARHHTVVFDPPSAVLVWGDAGRLAQVFSNLLLNAAKYTEPGGRITVAVAVREGEVAISVRDNGRGIDPATLPHVFDLFVQESAGSGMGVGLHVVQQLVAKHGGRVEARSAGRGSGSEFIVTVPRLTT